MSMVIKSISPKLVFAIGISLLAIKSFLQIPNDLESTIRGFTFGGYVAVIATPIIIYSLVIGIVALLIALVRRNIKKYWFSTFAWLLLIAIVPDLGFMSYDKFYLEPKTEKAACQAVFNGSLPKPSPREKELDNLYFQLNCQDFLADLKHDAAAGIILNLALWQYIPAWVMNIQVRVLYSDSL